MHKWGDVMCVAAVCSYEVFSKIYTCVYSFVCYMCVYKTTTQLMQMVRLTVKASSFPRACLAYFRLKSKSLYNTSTFIKDKTMPCFPHQQTQQTGHIFAEKVVLCFSHAVVFALESGSLNSVDYTFNLYFWVAIIPANLNTMTCLAEPPILPLSNSLNSKNENQAQALQLIL